MKKEDEEKLEELLGRSAFSELSFEEQTFIINAVGSEEEFIALQKIEEALQANESRSELLPDARVLISIKEKLRAHSSMKAAWYDFFFAKTPAYVTGLLMLFSFGLAIALFFNSKPIEKTMATDETKIDTVFVTTVDTVFAERVIYRQAKMISQSVQEIQTAKALERRVPVSSGVSMKDKEELNKLLVSGSD